jgi:competence protein ComEC
MVTIFLIKTIAQLYTSSNAMLFGTQIKGYLVLQEVKSYDKAKSKKINFVKKIEHCGGISLWAKSKIFRQVLDYQYAGAIHILSVSGCTLVICCFSELHYVKTNSQHTKGTIVKLLITLLTLASFAIIAGLSPSVCALLLCFLLWL